MTKNRGIISPVTFEQLERQRKFLGLRREASGVFYDPPSEGALRQEAWQELSPGRYELNLRSPLDDRGSSVVSFEDYFRTLRQRQLTEGDLAECDRIVDRFLDAVQRLEAWKISPGLLSPANVLVHRATHLKQPNVILVDVGFRPDDSPDLPPWLTENGEYGFLPERPPEEIIAAPFSSRAMVPYLSRLLAYLLDGFKLRTVSAGGVAEGSVAKIWQVLSNGCAGGVATVEELRKQVGKAVFSHHYVIGRSPRDGRRPDLVYPGPPDDRVRRKGFPLVKLLLLLLVVVVAVTGVIVYRNKPPEPKRLECCPQITTSSPLHEILTTWNDATGHDSFSATDVVAPSAIPIASTTANDSPTLAPPQAPRQSTAPQFLRRLHQLSLLEQASTAAASGDRALTPEEKECLDKLRKELYTGLGQDWDAIEENWSHLDMSPPTLRSEVFVPFNRVRKEFHRVIPNQVEDKWERLFKRRAREFGFDPDG